MEKEKPTTITAEEIGKRLLEVDRQMKELTNSKLIIMDKKFALKDWMTLTHYSKKYNVTIARIQNWIARGIIPQGSVIIVPELNYLKLIRNQIYEARQYGARAKNKPRFV